MIENDNDFLQKSGFLKNDIDRLCIEYENHLLEQSEDYLEYFKNEEETIIEKILNK